ncbi:PREDICTED: poly [ADP-ribose] polymerase 12 [Gavialis gangeticus]|uniref:poly [ADP-ribose] polymerase 12 n=1 Tax=Gavialis gangeticus TaxID=94835 RepID=UPI00092F1ACA|nr:PREDICTED: poly [ADP-ribose] polymerase 12 [Gavialis gangeticus]
MEYAWYWQDEHGEWIEYGQLQSNHSAATITSEELEEAFLNNQKKTVLFKAGSQYYELNFQDMVQRNLHYQTQRKVCRWPKLVSSGHSNKGWRRQTRTAAPGCPFPPDWDLSALPDVGYKLVEVSSTASEYMRIKDLFEKTMQNYYIHKLQRIQNPSLWQVFQWQKEQMKKINRQEDVDERLLFHGTNTSHLHAICEQNFDWRICGAHGTAYGKGSYFAKDASYSHGYCDPNSSHKTMFVAQVLVGDFVQGSTEYLRPPSKPKNPNRFYNSCVDNPECPSVFVIFEKHQIYPAYIIEYVERSSCVIL